MPSRNFLGIVAIFTVATILVAAGFCRYKVHQSSGAITIQPETVATQPRDSLAVRPLDSRKAEIAACDRAVLAGNTTSSREAAAQQSELAALYVPLIKTYGLDMSVPPLIATDQIYFVRTKSYSPNGGLPYYYDLWRATTTDLMNGTASPELLTQVPYFQQELISEFGVTDGVFVYRATGNVNQASPLLYAVYGINAQTGRSLWGITSTAIITPTLSSDGIYLNANGGLARVDPYTGRTLWQFKGGASFPFAIGDAVYVSGNATTSAVEPALHSNIYGLIGATGQVIEDIPITFDTVQSWDQCGGNIYFERGSLTFADAGRFDPQTGEVHYIGATNH